MTLRNSVLEEAGQGKGTLVTELLVHVEAWKE